MREKHYCLNYQMLVYTVKCADQGEVPVGFYDRAFLSCSFFIGIDVGISTIVNERQSELVNLPSAGRFIDLTRFGQNNFKGLGFLQEVLTFADPKNTGYVH
jgi:hypothetical protein